MKLRLTVMVLVDLTASTLAATGTASLPGAPVAKAPQKRGSAADRACRFVPVLGCSASTLGQAVNCWLGVSFAGRDRDRLDCAESVAAANLRVAGCGLWTTL